MIVTVSHKQHVIFTQTGSARKLHTAEFWITHNGNDRSHYDGKQGTIISEVESHLTS